MRQGVTNNYSPLKHSTHYEDGVDSMPGETITTCTWTGSEYKFKIVTHRALPSVLYDTQTLNTAVRNSHSRNSITAGLKLNSRTTKSRLLGWYSLGLSIVWCKATPLDTTRRRYNVQQYHGAGTRTRIKQCQDEFAKVFSQQLLSK